MAYMHTNLGGEVKISNRCPSNSILIAKGDIFELHAALGYLAEYDGDEQSTCAFVPGVRALPGRIHDSYFERKEAINRFTAQVQAFLTGGAA